MKETYQVTAQINAKDERVSVSVQADNFKDAWAQGDKTIRETNKGIYGRNVCIVTHVALIETPSGVCQN